jgi:hypothetical protein
VVAEQLDKLARPVERIRDGVQVGHRNGDADLAVHLGDEQWLAWDLGAIKRGEPRDCDRIVCVGGSDRDRR